MGLFESHVPVESITVMVQKEVADRMQTGPGSKGLRGVVSGRSVLCGTGDCSKCAAQLFYAKTKGGKRRDPPEKTQKEPPVQVQNEKADVPAYSRIF